MFNYSEIEASGQDRLNTFQAEAKHHEQVKQVQGEHSEQGQSMLLRVISLIRLAPERANDTSVTTCQTV